MDRVDRYYVGTKAEKAGLALMHEHLNRYNFDSDYRADHNKRLKQARLKIRSEPFAERLKYADPVTIGLCAQGEETVEIMAQQMTIIILQMGAQMPPEFIANVCYVISKLPQGPMRDQLCEAYRRGLGQPPRAHIMMVPLTDWKAVREAAEAKKEI